MVRLYPLFSGSSGNSNYIEFAPNRGILVDVGRSAKQIEKILNENNIRAENIEAIFITHEHTDHISGVKVFASRYGIRVYGSSGTVDSICQKGIFEHKSSCTVLKKSETDLSFACVKPFSISHDCCEGYGYTFTFSSSEKIAICTDLGYISEEVKSSLKGCQMVVLESNHDVMMLQNGLYPYYLKRRILSDNGHLSNESCGEILPFLVREGTKNIVLSHLSSNNNMPELAFQTALYHLNNEGMEMGKDFSLSVAPKVNNNCESFKI